MADLATQLEPVARQVLQLLCDTRVTVTRSARDADPDSYDPETGLTASAAPLSFTCWGAILPEGRGDGTAAAARDLTARRRVVLSARTLLGMALPFTPAPGDVVAAGGQGTVVLDSVRPLTPTGDATKSAAFDCSGALGA